MQLKKLASFALIALGLLDLVVITMIGLPVKAAQLPAQEGDRSQSVLASGPIFLPLILGFGGNVQPIGFIEHAGQLLDYTGASTCQNCHAQEVSDFGASNHYLWHGKFGSINDFCGFPDINFGPSKLTTTFGTLVDGGCATCHAGMGEKPTTSNAANADCLTCHASEYRRTAVLVGSVYRFVPDRANMPATISIQAEPTRFSCLTCHAYAGGGCNNKRGDMSDALVNPTEDNDVHMSTGMTCVDCHLTENHAIAGRGTDLRIDEGVAMRACTDCHDDVATIHSATLVRHQAKVACQSCHIPYFARAVSTDMLRDFRTSEVNARGLYEPTITRASNVIPEYAFWNGSSGFYNFGDPAVVGQLLSWPLGDIMDGKLFPFKLHQAIQPQDPVSGAILPVKAGILFQTGDMNQSILVGAQESGFNLTQGYTFVETGRYMGIFHEMPPASQALSCSACHTATDRVDFSALGYDPKPTRNGEPLCESCHGSEDMPSFTSLHDKHVRGEDIACSTCHNFSR